MRLSPTTFLSLAALFARRGGRFGRLGSGGGLAGAGGNSAILPSALCLRQAPDWEAGAAGGLYFNIADNDQPRGPLSAADNYSMFNSDADMGAFELETIGAAQVEGKHLKGSKLVSLTTAAVFADPGDLRDFMAKTLGNAPGE